MSQDMNESSLIQVMEYLIANEFYDAYDALNRNIESTQLPWAKYRSIYHRIRYHVLKSIVDQPEMYFPSSAFLVLKQLTLHHYKQKTIDYYTTLKELVYLKFLYYVKKDIIELGDIIEEYKELLLRNDESDDESEEWILEDLDYTDLETIETEIRTLIESLEADCKEKQIVDGIVHRDQLSSASVKIIESLQSAHKPSNVARILSEYLKPINLGFGKSFIDMVNDDIDKGLYKPSFLHCPYKTDIPENLLNAKLDLDDILNVMTEDEQLEFKNEINMLAEIEYPKDEEETHEEESDDMILQEQAIQEQAKVFKASDMMSKFKGSTPKA